MRKENGRIEMFTEREWRELCRLHEMLPWSSWGGRRAHILERKLVEEAGKPEMIVQKGGGTWAGSEQGRRGEMKTGDRKFEEKEE